MEEDMITILFLAANPTDATQLKLAEECRAITLALRQTEFRDQFKVEQHGAVRAEDLSRLLLQYKPNIVHFSGHGSESAEIILENERGQSHPVSERALKELFSILKENLRLVVLNACYSQQQAKAIAEVVDCVIGMSTAIGDQAAIQFASEFYQGLGYGRDVQTAFKLGRVRIDLANLEEQNTPQLIARKADPARVVFVDVQPAPGSKLESKSESEASTRRSSPAITVAIIGAIAVILAVVLGSFFMGRLKSSMQTPTAVSKASQSTLVSGGTVTAAPATLTPQTVKPSDAAPTLSVTASPVPLTAASPTPTAASQVASEVKRLAGYWAGWAKDPEGRGNAANIEINEDGSFLLQCSYTGNHRGVMRLKDGKIVFETVLKTVGTVTLGVDGEGQEQMTLVGFNKVNDPKLNILLNGDPVVITLTRGR
jgi:hypothetical protein